MRKQDTKGRENFIEQVASTKSMVDHPELVMVLNSATREGKLLIIKTSR